VGEVEQQLQFAQGDLSEAFAASFLEPFLSNRPEAVHFGQRAGDLVDLALGGRIDALGNLLLEFEALGARLGQRNGGIDPEGCRGSLFPETIIDPPAPLPRFGNEQVERAPIGKLVWLVACNGFSDGQIGQHDATFLSVSIPSKIPSDTVNCNEFDRMRVDTPTVKNL
jgi:hypothetical protein